MRVSSCRLSLMIQALLWLKEQVALDGKEVSLSDKKGVNMILWLCVVRLLICLCFAENQSPYLLKIKMRWSIISHKEIHISSSIYVSPISYNFWNSSFPIIVMAYKGDIYRRTDMIFWHVLLCEIYLRCGSNMSLVDMDEIEICDNYENIAEVTWAEAFMFNGYGGKTSYLQLTLWRCRYSFNALNIKIKARIGTLGWEIGGDLILWTTRIYSSIEPLLSAKCQSSNSDR